MLVHIHACVYTACSLLSLRLESPRPRLLSSEAARAASCRQGCRAPRLSTCQQIHTYIHANRSKRASSPAQLMHCSAYSMYVKEYCRAGHIRRAQSFFKERGNFFRSTKHARSQSCVVREEGKQGCDQGRCGKFPRHACPGCMGGHLRAVELHTLWAAALSTPGYRCTAPSTACCYTYKRVAAARSVAWHRQLSARKDA